MSVVYYRKYRSLKLEDIVGQKHITETLRKALTKQKIGHAYLLTGPRGVGKTSVARIFAHEVNGLSYDQAKSHFDIIEIDAASSGKIEEIRDLRQKANLVPGSLKYKVYIIDEVHMISRAGFDALLKILEEPPGHIIFILATTEVHKVPETIVSRCQRFTFKQIGEEELVKHLAKVAKLEKVKIDKPALQIIAEHSQGSLRDALSLLEQIAILGGQIDADKTRQIIGLPKQQQIQKIVTACFKKDLKTVVETYRGLMVDGYDCLTLVDQIIKLIRLDPEIGSKIDLLEDLLEVPRQKNPEAYLEMVLVKHSLDRQQSRPAPEAKPLQVQTPVSQTEVADKPEQAAAKSRPERRLAISLWSEIKQEALEKTPLIAGILEKAEASVEAKTLILKLPNIYNTQTLKKHQDKLKQLLDDLGIDCQEIAVEQKFNEPKPADGQKTVNISGLGELRRIEDGR